MPQYRRTMGLLAGALAVGPVATSSGAVSLFLGNKTATPTSVTVGTGINFPVDVFLKATSTGDDISSVDYRLSASVAGRFQLVSRTSTAVLSPYLADSSSSVAPVTFNFTPSNLTLATNGATNLGGLTPNGSPDLTGSVAGITYELADFQIQALPGTPAGVYTLGFDTTRSGTSATNVTSFGTFQVTVPEPASGAIAIAGVFGTGLLRRARKGNQAAE